MHPNDPISLFVCRCLSLQVTFVTRVIDADQYNAAVVDYPEHCPLIAAGDLRSGRQAPPLFSLPLTRSDVTSFPFYFHARILASPAIPGREGVGYQEFPVEWTKIFPQQL